jgi:dsRNA-specific ribonuclease
LLQAFTLPHIIERRSILKSLEKKEIFISLLSESPLRHERLEFLGDAFLNYSVLEILYFNVLNPEEKSFGEKLETIHCLKAFMTKNTYLSWVAYEKLFKFKRK